MVDASTIRGLSQADAERRLREVGPNALPRARPTPLALRFARQFASPLMYVLVAAVAIDLAIWWYHGAQDWPVEAIAIAAILLLNAGFGVFQERKAEAALARLQSLASASAWALRDGELRRIPAQELVPDDVVRLEAGDRIPADAKLLDAALMVDESIVTGESVPVDKDVDDELLSGTLVVRGKGYARLTRTGPTSTMGRLAAMLTSIEPEPTPLERRLNRFGHQVAWAVLAVGALMLVAGVWIEGLGQLDRVFLFAVALAVAVIPEGLPAVLTLTLALGVERMARRRALVRRLAAVESLGSVTVIATDKTGTLTENRMTVKAVDAVDEARALRAMVIANDAEFDTRAGDPLELALLDYASGRGIDVQRLQRGSQRVGTLPFDSAHRFMRVTVDNEGDAISHLKGAPEALLGRSTLDAGARADWTARAQRHAAHGYRVLALAERAGAGDDALDFLGLALLWDPPRPEVPAAIRAAQDAGIRVLMITGDHPATAAAVADAVGIARGRTMTGTEVEALSPTQLAGALRDVSVFARVTPEHKLRVVEALKSAGEVVAVTGDGVNDAPALKRADVGVAMGQRGSDVAREVADLVLIDDNFATIVAAIEEGRSIYENIQKFVRFFFSTDLALVLLVVLGLGISLAYGLAEAGGALFLPLTAVQLLWINVVADGPPALALALDRNPDLMRVPPRPLDAPLLDRRSLRFIVVSGLVKAGAGAAVLFGLPRAGVNADATRSALFLLESLLQIVFAYPARHVSVTPLPNRTLHWIVGLGIALQFLTLLLPGLRALLGLTPLPALAWASALLAFVLCWGIAEGMSRTRRP
ncbi:MAG: cation-translocating P-type ATPase [Gemmatimonadota bacterium]